MIFSLFFPRKQRKMAAIENIGARGHSRLPLSLFLLDL